MPQIDLLFATGNRAKLRQMAYVIDFLAAPIELISARERYGNRAAYDEIGTTSREIAIRGALEVAERLGAAVLTEDTAFYVDDLGGEPGIAAGRYLADHGRADILNALDGKSNRRAWIVSAAAYAHPDGQVDSWETTVHGSISREDRWQEGLPDWIAPTRENPAGGGYNAIFVPSGQTRTLAEIPAAEAIRLGYREPNFCKIIEFLIKL